MLAGHARYALIAVIVAAGLASASIAIWAEGGPRRSRDVHPQLASVARRRSVEATNWQMIQAAASLRENALAPNRTAFHRAFAAYMGLGALLRVHHALRGRCATAVSYLYDNLLDLHDAYTGEDWMPLRQAVATEPSLAVCAPRARSQRARAGGRYAL